MKVKLLPLAIGAAIAMPGVALADGPTVYGKMNVTYEYVTLDDGTTDASNGELNSNASRLGFKGSEDINSDLTAFYQAEFEISVDGDKQEFKQRDIFVGLKGGWGAVKLGEFDSPMKKSQGKIDMFNDLQYGDIGKVLLNGDNRLGDLVQYSTPAMGGITANLAIQSDEENSVEGGGDPTEDGISASVVYETDMIFASVAMDDGVKGWDTTRLTAIGKMDGFQVGFLYEVSEEAVDGPAEENTAYVLSASAKLGGNNKIYGQYGFAELDLTDSTTDETTQFGVGVSHSLSKQTKLFAHYLMVEEENTGITGTDEASTLALGVEHKF